MASAELLAEMVSQSTGERYEIRRGHDGNVYCTCLGWRFSKLRPKTCKHLGLYNDDVVLRPEDLDRGPFVRPAMPPTALEHALELTRKMVAAARLHHITEGMIRLMAQALSVHLPQPTATVQTAPGRVRLITFDEG